MRIFVPLVILCAALMVILGYQIYLNGERHAKLTEQMELVKKQEEQTSLFKAKYQSIINDLRQLAASDPDAQALVRRHIKVQPGAPAPAAPAQ